MKEVHISLNGLGAAFGEALHLPAGVFSGWYYGGQLPLRRSPTKRNRGEVALNPAELAGLTFCCSLAAAGGRGRKIGRAFRLVTHALEGLRPTERAWLIADMETGWCGCFISTEPGVPRPESRDHRVVPLSDLAALWRAALDTRPEGENAAVTIRRVLAGVDLGLSPPLPAEAVVEEPA